MPEEGTIQEPKTESGPLPDSGMNLSLLSLDLPRRRMPKRSSRRPWENCQADGEQGYIG